MPERFDEMSPASELTMLADTLKGLAPAATSIQRDRVLFEAGRAAARPSWLWPACTLVFASAAVVLACFVMFVERPKEIVVVEREKIVEVTVAVPMEQGPPPRSQSPEPYHEPQLDTSPSPEMIHMYRVRRDVLRWGVAMLPPSRPTATTPLAVSDAARDLERWLDVPAGTLGAPYGRPMRLFPRIGGDN